MADTYIGEIRIFGGNFAPDGWALCNGQLLSVQQNTALYSLLGTQFGGDGKTTFGVPNLQGMAVMHAGAGPGLTTRTQGQTGGAATVTVQTSQVPQHSHTYMAGPAGKGEVNAVTNNVNSDAPALTNIYGPAGGAQMNAATLAPTPASQPHENMQPYQVLNFIIALMGYYPVRG